MSNVRWYVGLAMVVGGLLEGGTRAYAVSYTATWTTVDSPLGYQMSAFGTRVTGVSGNTVVGSYWDIAGTHGFRKIGNTYEKIDYPINVSGYNPAIGGGTYVTGVSGSSVVGYYRYDTGYLLTAASAPIIPEGYAGASVYGFVRSGDTYTTLKYPLASIMGVTTVVTAVSGPTAIGYYIGDDRNQHGFSCSAGDYTPIDVPLALCTFPMAIDGSTVAGYYIDSLYGGHGFVDVGGGYTRVDVPGASDTYVTAISGGILAGCYRAGSKTYSFVLSDGTYTTLSDPLATGNTIITSVSGNTVGGYYIDSAGSHGFIASLAAVPEPSTLVLMGAGAMALLAKRGREARRQDAHRTRTM